MHVDVLHFDNVIFACDIGVKRRDQIDPVRGACFDPQQTLAFFFVKPRVGIAGKPVLHRAAMTNNKLAAFKMRQRTRKPGCAFAKRSWNFSVARPALGLLIGVVAAENFIRTFSRQADLDVL